MRILVVGASGTIGKYISFYYKSEEHEVIEAHRSSHHFPVNLESASSIHALFEKVGSVDAIICAAGEAKWAPFNELSEQDYYVGLESKLMGQVNLVRIGQNYLQQGGSITLTTGILADDPVATTASAAMVNGAINSFVQAAALEMVNGNRLNVVSSGVVADAYAKYKPYFPGHPPIPMEKMMLGYVRSVEGKVNGEVIRIYK